MTRDVPVQDKKTHRILALLLLVGAAGAAATAQEPLRFRVMSFNVLQGGGDAAKVGFPDADFGGARRDDLARVIEGAGADIVGVQELAYRSEGGEQLLTALGEGWHRAGTVFAQHEMTVVETSPDFTVVRVHLAPGRDLTVVNTHWWPAGGYGPDLVLARLKAGTVSDDPVELEREVLAELDSAGGPRGYDRTLRAVRAHLDAGERVVLVGDFNEPSHLDWTARAARDGIDRWVGNPTGRPLRFRVEWPGSRLLQQAGMVDAYRAVFPDEVATPGNTWTPPYPDGTPGRRAWSDQVLDRIDFIYFGDDGLTVRDAAVVGESAATAEVVHPGRWPSDHRAVVATFEWTAQVPRPRPAQLAWQEAELGALVCYELHTFSEGRYRQQDARVTPIEDVDRFAPAELDTDQWARVLRDAGFRFALLTVSHESGFRLWQSDANPYCLKALRWGDGRRDLAREFVDACRRHGIRPGFYVGTRWNAQLGVIDFEVTERSPITQAGYNDLIEREVEELCTRYGDLFEFWFDGGAHGPEQGGPDVLSIVEEHQPGAVFYHNLQRADARWGGSETGTVPYPCWATFPYPATGSGESAVSAAIARDGFHLLKVGDPDGRHWVPAMSDAPLRGHGGHEWFWEPGDEHLIQPLPRLIDIYRRSVGHNSTLILGVTPDTRGLIPDADAARLREFGAELRRMFGSPVVEVAGGGEVIEFEQTFRFDHVVLQEDIRHGERVREYRLEVREDGAWRTLASGSCIGHKRIHQVPAQRADALRLVVTSSRATPRIRRVAMFDATAGSGR
jgi:alpha-L-fucosidase